jgi:pimeloyl-ACP methyl ester carboxylesterase
MMTPRELFDHETSGNWVVSGTDVSWRFSVVDDEHLLEFRCTVDAEGWRQNFKFLPRVGIPYKNMRHRWFAHAGFIEMWRSVRDLIADRVAFSTKTDAFPVIHVVGYSQGGALAILAAEDLRFRGYATTLTTFGAPRVFWGIVPHKVRIRATGTHFHRRGDIVTMVPFSVLGYSRFGHTKKIGPPAFPWWTHHRPQEYQSYLPI